MNERQAYTEKMKAKLDEWNADIDKLEAQAKSAEADAQIKFNSNSTDSRPLGTTLPNGCGELQNASTDAWDTLRQGTEAAWEEMATAFKDATDRFK